MIFGKMVVQIPTQIMWLFLMMEDVLSTKNGIGMNKMLGLANVM